MNCSNCQITLDESASYCTQCGAKVIRGRITFKRIVQEGFSSTFGWDNLYFLTLRTMISSPSGVLKDYIGGVRKKYLNPFTFFALSAGITLLVLNFFDEEYLSLSSNLSQNQGELIQESADAAIDTEITEAAAKAERIRQEQIKLNDKIQRFILRHFNLVSFLLLPLYALIARIVFGKPYNYGEHLIISAYIQGVTFLGTTTFFLISLVSTPYIYFLTMPVAMVFYLYVYTRLYDLSALKIFLRLLKFLLVMVLFLIVLMLLGVLVGVIYGLMN